MYLHQLPSQVCRVHPSMPSSRLIVDVGSGLAKVGYGCTDIPTFLFPSLVGKARKTASPRFVRFCGSVLRCKTCVAQLAYIASGFSFCPRESRSALATGDAFVGIDAYKRRGDLSVHRPVQGGIVRGWDDYETLLMAILYQHLRFGRVYYSVLQSHTYIYLTLPFVNYLFCCRAPETPDIFLAESPTNSSACRERTAEMIFETFDASALTVASQATLSLINSLYGPAALQTSKIPRIVVESGYGVTHVVPYSSNGLPIESAIQSSTWILRRDEGAFSQVFSGITFNADVALFPCAVGVDLVGSVLDVQLKLLLAGSNDFSPQQSDGRVFESIKHKHCYVAQDYMLELAKFANNDRSEVERKEIVRK
jgi:hypothetical protein